MTEKEQKDKARLVRGLVENPGFLVIFDDLKDAAESADRRYFETIDVEERRKLEREIQLFRAFNRKVENYLDIEL